MPFENIFNLCPSEMSTNTYVIAHLRIYISLTDIFKKQNTHICVGYISEKEMLLYEIYNNS